MRMKLTWMLGLMLVAHPTAVSDHLLLTDDNKPITTINRADIQSDIPGVPLIDDDKYDMLLKKIQPIVYKPPVNAKLDRAGNIISEQPGSQLNSVLFKEEFYRTFYNHSQPSIIKISKVAIYPKVDSELLASVRSKQISHYYTYFNTHNKNRSHNISLATEAINNQVIFPGETFSFNRTVGQRTKEKGYLPAKIIVRGEFSEGIGGGICQVSSTLFNAVDRAGLEVTQRFSHSKTVHYVPPGRDATVSWYGPDFNFRNNYDQPLLIRAYAKGSTVSIMLFSTNDLRYEPKSVPSIQKEDLVPSAVD